jgi:WD40 repeat protein
MIRRFLCLVLACSAFVALTAQDEDHTLWTARWSPDGQYIATGGNDGILRLFDGKTYEHLTSDTLGVYIMRIAWHPTKNLMLMGHTSGAYLYHPVNGVQLALQGLESGARGIGWNHDGTLIGVGDGEGRLLIWNEKGELQRTITKGATKSYVALDWHPQEDRLMVLSEKVRQYDTEGQLLSLEQHREDLVLMLCVEWHPSGQFFAIGDYGSPPYGPLPVLQFWKEDGSLLKTIEVGRAEYRNIRWRPDGERLATASDALRIWSKTGALLQEIPVNHLLWGIDWSPDGQVIVTSDDQGAVAWWDPNGKPLKQWRVNKNK